jgi:hypothetical protein
MKITKIDDQIIDQLFADCKHTYGGVRNDFFAPAYLVAEHEIPIEKALLQTTFGGRDYGFDAFDFDQSTGNLYLYQFKWSEDASLFKDCYRRMIDAGIDRIFVGSYQDPKQNQALLQIKSLLLEKKALVNAVFIRFVFKGDPKDAENSSVLSKLQEDLGSKKYLIDNFFGREVNLVIDYRSSRGHIGGVAVQTKTYSYLIDFGDETVKKGPGGELMHMGSLKLYELNSMFEEMRQRLLDRNIRSGLTGDESPNRAITRSLREIVLDEKADPAVFFFNHNGVTMFAQKFERDDGRYKITEPRILNGAQTITSFNKFLAKFSDHPKLKSNRDRLEEIEVPCRIITDASDDFVISVTVNNNRQNPVKPWALRANDMIQLQLADKFQQDLKIYYGRQENAFHNLTDEDLERMEIEQLKEIELRRLASTFLISDGEVDKASRLPEVFDDDKAYSSVFGKSRLNADSRKILLCYKVQFKLRRLTDEIQSRGERKYAFARRARNLTWALICQGVLNDPELEDYAERYGRWISVEVGFVEWMRDIAVNKVRLLLSDLVEIDQYRQKMAEERYDFLRTRAAYDVCMQRAYKRWKWVDQKLR